MKKDGSIDAEVLSQPQEWQWITFKISGTRYCHPIADIEEIFHFTEPTPVPGAPHGILGILNIRGSIATIYSGRLLFDLPKSDPGKDWRIITLSFDDNLIGISVDSVEEIIHFDPELVERTTDVTDQKTLVKGTIYTNDRLYSVLDFYRLINDD